MTRPDAPMVLIVDDAVDTLDMLNDAVGFHGFRATSAASGIEALRAARANAPDLILLDARMPAMDGFETCELLKSDPPTQDIPVIFMTGYDDPDHVVRAFASGGVDFVLKPVNLDELFARMNVHLGQARRQRSARIALEATGRLILSLSGSGLIQWRTGQAADLLSRAGLPSAEGARMPFAVLEWLKGGGEESLMLNERAAPVELRHLERTEGDVLIRLVDRSAGTDVERLSREFDLTAREAEVLLWLAHGKSNKEIGDILETSHRTVNKHLEQIFVKLGVENRTSAATTAVRVLWTDI